MGEGVGCFSVLYVLRRCAVGCDAKQDERVTPISRITQNNDWPSMTIKLSYSPLQTNTRKAKITNHSDCTARATPSHADP